MHLFRVAKTHLPIRDTEQMNPAAGVSSVDAEIAAASQGAIEALQMSSGTAWETQEAMSLALRSPSLACCYTSSHPRGCREFERGSRANKPSRLGTASGR